MSNGIKREEEYEKENYKYFNGVLKKSKTYKLHSLYPRIKLVENEIKNKMF